MLRGCLAQLCSMAAMLGRLNEPDTQCYAAIAMHDLELGRSTWKQFHGALSSESTDEHRSLGNIIPFR